MNAFGQGERTGRWNRPVLHCANEANVVTEDDTVDGDRGEATLGFPGARAPG